MKTYQRPITGWWRRNPYYLWYMLREASCVFITAYALVLLVGLARLAQGEVAFEDWLESLSGTGSLAFHAAAFILVLYHAWTWFKVMPKTLPFVRFGGRRVPDTAIVSIGVAGAVAASAALFVAVWWFGLWSVQ
jgi:fumarate reductase subunit C